MTTGRDRDETGRARQQRPRDALGRPLPYGAAGVEPVPEEALPPLETIEVARDLVREGRPFAAHEVLEARWKAGPDDERDLWQGLAQLCVGLTHLQRGNAVGAVRLLTRGAGRLPDDPPYGVDAALAGWALRLAADVEAGRREADPSPVGLEERTADVAGQRGDPLRDAGGRGAEGVGDLAHRAAPGELEQHPEAVDVHGSIVSP